MPSSIFISYDATSDYDFAHRLAADLSAIGQKIWIAPDSIELGESFPSAISRGLDTASVFLLVVTPAGLGSPWVKAEVDAAIDLEKKGQLRIIPLLTRDTTLPPLLGSYQMLEVTDYDTTFRGLMHALGVTSTATSASRSPTLGEDATPAAREGYIPLEDEHRQSIFRALQFGAEHYDYMIHLAAPYESSPISWIAERELLRVGVAVFTGQGEKDEQVLSKLTQELTDNPHRVIGMVGVQPGEVLRMKMYQIVEHDPNPILRLWEEDRSHDIAPPQIVHLRWKAEDGDSALAQALDMFFRLLRTRKSLPKLTTDPFVESALSAVANSTRLLQVEADRPEARNESIVRVLLDPLGVRIGVAVWPDQDVDPGDILADMSRELHSNPLDITALIGVHPSRHTGIQRQNLMQTGKPDGFVFAWNPKSGADAMRGGLARILESFKQDESAADDPFAAAFHHGRADAFVEAGIPEEALLEAEDAIRLDGSLVDAYVVRAQALLMLGRLEAAVAAVDKALSLDPENPGAHTTRADALLAMGRASDALEAADRGIGLEPRLPALHSIRSDALLELDQPVDALAAAEQAIRLDSQDPRNHTIKATALLELGRATEALKAVNAALNLEPDDTYANEVKDQILGTLKEEQS